MRTYTLQFNEPTPTHPTIPQGESGATTLRINCAPALAHWPGAGFLLLLRRADGQPYTALPLTTPDDTGHLLYTLTAADTALPGPLSLEIQARDGNTLAKSWTHTLEILPALGNPTDPPPNPALPPEGERWMDILLTAVSDTTQAAVTATAAAEAAQSAHDAMVEEEQLRQAQEFDRVEAEGDRLLAEAARMEAEDNRAEAEAERMEAEAARERLATQAAQAAQAAGAQALADGQAAVEMALAIEDSLPARAATPWNLLCQGHSVRLRAVPDSTLLVHADRAATVTDGSGLQKALAPGVWTPWPAGDGDCRLLAGEACLTVRYHAPSMDILTLLTTPREDMGGVARVDGAVAGLPLAVSVDFVQMDGEQPPAALILHGVNLADAREAARNSAIASQGEDGRLTFKPDLPIGWFREAPLFEALLRAGETYTLTAEGFGYGRLVLTTQAGATPGAANYPDIDITAGASGISNLLHRGGTATTFRANRTERVYAYYCTDAGRTIDTNGFTCGIQLEKGDTRSTYAPFVQSAAPALALPQPAYGLPGAPDTLDVTGGHFIRRTALRAFAPGDVWTKGEGTTYATPNPGQRDGGACRCTHFACALQGGLLHLLDTGFDTPEALAAYLADNAVSAVYQRETEAITPVTPAPLAALSGTNTVCAGEGSVRLTARTLHG